MHTINHQGNLMNQQSQFARSASIGFHQKNVVGGRMGNPNRESMTEKGGNLMSPDQNGQESRLSSYDDNAISTDP